MKVLVNPDEFILQVRAEFSPQDYLLSSLLLGEPIDNLVEFTRSCFIITDEYYNRLMIEEARKIDKYSIEFKNGTILFFLNKLDWKALNTLYAVYNSSNKKDTAIKISNYNEHKALEMNSLILLKQDFAKILIKSSEDFKDRISFFNSTKMIDEFKLLDIKAELYKTSVLVTLDNVRVGNDAEGYIIYNQILLFINDFTLEGFILKFDNFDYSSFWNIPCILHPYLYPPYCFNNMLEFIPANNYKVFAKSLIDTVSDIKGDGLKSISSIIEDIQDLRILWNGYREKIPDRLDLSRTILTKKVNEI